MSGGGELRLPPGFRFHPTDDELVKHYLCRKCTAEPIRVPFIAEIDLYRYDPWQLPGMALYGEKEWYFFSPRDRKYPNGSRPNRAAGSGYWKATGADKQIGFPNPIAIKKALVFYVGKAPKGEKTNWIMHEYRLADVDRSARRKNSLRLDDWVLCRIYNKKGASEKQISPYRKPTPETPRQDSSVLQFPNQQLQVVPTTPVTTHLHMSEYPNMYFENSDSIPKLHTDSSCSDQVPSSWERESQSQPAAWIADWERHVEVQIDTVSQPSFPPMPRDDSLMSPAFGDPVLHDIMTYLQKPF